MKTSLHSSDITQTLSLCISFPNFSSKIPFTSPISDGSAPGSSQDKCPLASRISSHLKLFMAVLLSFLQRPCKPFIAFRIVEKPVILFFQSLYYMIGVFVVRRGDTKLFSHSDKRTREHIYLGVSACIKVL